MAPTETLKTTATHIYFWGSIYSQWFRREFKDGNRVYNTAEAYMMTQKALLFGDLETAAKIQQTLDPRQQKALGRTVRGFEAVKWDQHKLEIVIQGNLLKFAQHPDLKAALLATGTKVLVEGSPYDTIWGVGLKWDDPKILEERNWRGQNLLGQALMEVRRRLTA